MDLIQRMIDCLRQWGYAELANDPEEMNNARYERDNIISKLIKEQANAQSTKQANQAGG